jgi:hypothetical protein
MVVWSLWKESVRWKFTIATTFAYIHLTNDLTNRFGRDMQLEMHAQALEA